MTLACASEPQEAPSPRYVGSVACGKCHVKELFFWRGSHHDRAIDSPSAALGWFDDVTFEHGTRRSRFSRDADGFWVESVAAGAEPRRHRVAYTFGLEPLQQLLLDVGGGRLQAYDVAWDSRPAEEGGQRWFELPTDSLHWTGPYFNWNGSCAACHSTALEKGYDAETDTFETTFAELDVGCEACHGPGHRHAASAGAEPLPTQPQLEVCSGCHSRRSELTTPDPTALFLDQYRPALLERELYFADGQMRDEVFVWGSFLQSRMYEEGVVCSDCHDPHVLELRQPDRVCASCHPPEQFARPEHHKHGAESAGSSCVGCHMPARTYMGVDARRDHAFRIPRPSLESDVESPDACLACHADRDRAWSVAETERLWGQEREHPFARALHAAWTHGPEAHAALLRVIGDERAPGIARATAVAALRDHPIPQSLTPILQAARDPEPLVRLAAADAGDVLSLDAQARLTTLLDDPVRAIRSEAARALAGNPEVDPARLGTALEEYAETLQRNRDRPDARLAAGVLARRLGNSDAAAKEYAAALRLDPEYVPALVNLADLHRERGDESASVTTLERAVRSAPDSAVAHHAYGLALIRAERRADALVAFQRAAALDPTDPALAHTYALALDAAGARQRALEVARAGAQRHPAHPGLQQLLRAWTPRAR